MNEKNNDTIKQINDDLFSVGWDARVAGFIPALTKMFIDEINISVGSWKFVFPFSPNTFDVNLLVISTIKPITVKQSRSPTIETNCLQNYNRPFLETCNLYSKSRNDKWCRTRRQSLIGDRAIVNKFIRIEIAIVNGDTRMEWPVYGFDQEPMAIGDVHQHNGINLWKRVDPLDAFVIGHWR